MRSRLALLAFVCATALAASVQAAEPVRQIGIYVLPYYTAGASFAEAPKVAVDPAYDKLLQSTQAADIRKVRDGVAAQPDLVKPETMMVLAIRLYDTGMRDDAVFWYYAARDRYLTMDSVLDMRSLKLARVSETIASFTDAVGPVIDGYAFCNLAHQQEREDRAISWVAAHPYKLLGYADLPALAEDRNAGIVAAIAQLRDAAANAKAFMAQPENVKRFAAERARVDADAHYCWK
ncbi:MAG: hypothetical protein ABJD97_20350 [Betaproteobacteria bacterium]